ncbi:hypothetical protein BK131_22845 [Paenibacillus amylolyticus]|uniref:Lipoprotein n=1 Tax=Paenibacillus amylolyticus TaxID=1451 RepID=A0A1R1BLR6_PAEAM|nr:hypothetical protein [Paenibacillus amylolyticus]OMF10843.1 hypothetical protein BK131_22845 [Paenibacillus amylolyticus]
MRKNKYFTSVTLLLLLGCSVMLTACDVITAQNITNTGSAQGMNGGGMPNGGGMGMNGGTPRGGRGGTGMNDRTGSPDMTQGMMNADMTGRVISVNGNTVTLALLEVQDNSSPSMEWKDTGMEMNLNISDDVTITEGVGTPCSGSSNRSANSSIQVSDLQKEDIVMVWYKDNTETVERVMVVQ